MTDKETQVNIVTTVKSDDSTVTITNPEHGEVRVTFFIGDDDMSVVQIDTYGDVRINVNDGELATVQRGDHVVLPVHWREYEKPEPHGLDLSADPVRPIPLLSEDAEVFCDEPGCEWGYIASDQQAAEDALADHRRGHDIYVARFTPEAWIGDNAVEVDADGEQEWDCTIAVMANPDYFGGKSWDDPLGVLDCDDVLKDDPNAPDWVRDWRGPFTIRVHRVAQTPSGGEHD